MPGLTQLRTIILQPGEKLSWGAANLVIAHMEFIFFLSMLWLLLYPLLHLDTLTHFRNLLEKLLDWARTASDLWASAENTSVCTRCLEQQRKACGKPAWKRVCGECSLFHQESCTQILRNELSLLTGTISLLNNHCSLIVTLPASSSAPTSSIVSRLPKQEEKPSLHNPCKAQQQQGKHFLHCCC